MQTYTNGVKIEVVEGQLLINGKSPSTIVDLGGGWHKASTIIVRLKNPRKASGCRKRKKALMSAAKKYRFSIKFKQE